MKKGSYGSLESVSTNKYILRLMSDMKKLYMCNLEKVILFNIMKRTTTLLSALILALSLWAQTSVETQRQYLSGKGCDDMVEWDFFCTGGNNSGKWSKIGVPSCWELQGFGTYQYGMKFYGKPFRPVWLMRRVCIGTNSICPPNGMECRWNLCLRDL